MSINTTECKVQKPFLKWVGGKSQIINTIISKLPSTMNNYHELFLGGGCFACSFIIAVRQNYYKK